MRQSRLRIRTSSLSPLNSSHSAVYAFSDPFMLFVCFRCLVIRWTVVAPTVVAHLMVIARALPDSP
eukprot:1414048-Heterocapsa_arctica.AAC.1